MKNPITAARNSTEVSEDKFKEISQKVEPKDICRTGEKNKTFQITCPIDPERKQRKWRQEAKYVIQEGPLRLTRVSSLKGPMGAQEKGCEEAHTNACHCDMAQPWDKEPS